MLPASSLLIDFPDGISDGQADCWLEDGRGRGKIRGAEEEKSADKSICRNTLRNLKKDGADSGSGMPDKPEMENDEDGMASSDSVSFKVVKCKSKFRINFLTSDLAV